MVTTNEKLDTKDLARLTDYESRLEKEEFDEPADPS